MLGGPDRIRTGLMEPGPGDAGDAEDEQPGPKAREDGC